MSHYLEIVPKEQIKRNGSTVTIDRKDAEIYKPLKRIAYGANNGHADWTEDVTITYPDETTETVRGHVIATGHVQELEAQE